MEGDRGLDSIIESAKQYLESSVKGDITAVRDPKQVDYIMNMMMQKLRYKMDNNSSSSDTENEESKRQQMKPMDHKRVNFSTKENRKHSNKFRDKIHSYKQDKPIFDSYNVFNRCSLPKSGKEVYPCQTEVTMDVQPSRVASENKDELGKALKCDPSAKLQATPVELRPKISEVTELRAESVRTKKLSSKRPKMSKRPRQYSSIGLKKRPMSRNTVDEIESQIRKYCFSQDTREEQILTVSEELKKQRVDGSGEEGHSDETNPTLEQADVLFGDADTNVTNDDGHKGQSLDSLQISLEEPTLVTSSTILAEMRHRKNESGRYWDSAVVFVNQGLAYNRLAKEKNIWKTLHGSITSDVNDPAIDAVILTQLALGGVLVPPSSDDKFEYTSSFLDVMLEKYPVLRQEAQTEEVADYTAILQKFAQTFPLLITTCFIHSDCPLLDSLSHADYGLPPAVFDQGFPCLACPHLLEKSTNILPFLVDGLLQGVGEVFGLSDWKFRLEMAWIVWTHLQKLIDTTALPWIWREAFCRRYGICGGLRQDYLSKRNDVFDHLASALPQVDRSYKLFGEINEFDYRKNCPMMNSFEVSSVEIDYMRVFYNSVINVFKETYKQNNDDIDDVVESECPSDLTEEIERHLRKSEEEEIREMLSIPGEHRTEQAPKRRYIPLITNLKDEID